MGEDRWDGRGMQVGRQRRTTRTVTPMLEGPLFEAPSDCLGTELHVVVHGDSAGDILPC